MHLVCVFQVTGVFSKEYIPQGTRFGPLQGDIYTKDSVPKQANRKYFWRVREHLHHTQAICMIKFRHQQGHPALIHLLDKSQL